MRTIGRSLEPAARVGEIVVPAKLRRADGSEDYIVKSYSAVPLGGR